MIEIDYIPRNIAWTKEFVKLVRTHKFIIVKCDTSRREPIRKRLYRVGLYCNVTQIPGVGIRVERYT